MDEKQPNEQPDESRKTLTEASRTWPPLNLPPDVQAKIDAFRKGIAAELADNLNRAVLDKEKADPE